MKHFDPHPLGHFKIDWLQLGDMVFKMREANGMSLRDAAALLGISAPTLCRVEQGHPVQPDHLFTLLQFVGAPFQLPESVLVAGISPTERE